MFGRYEYSLIELCEKIGCAYRFTGDPIHTEELKRMRDWLEWRTTDGWETASAASAYDAAVLALALASLDFAREMIAGNR